MNKISILDCGAVPGAPELQTEAIQKAFDLCKNGGGTVVIPAGKFRTASLRMYSDTTLYLCAGAILEGSGECDDYEIYPVPEGVEMRSDMELIPQQYNYQPWEAYRRAIISAYGEKNIAIVGEGVSSVIDGVHCYDPDGEEHYRGPHAIYITNCENVRLENYTAKNAGNFMHQLDNCQNTVMRRVTCLAGSDGIHLHHCDHTLIEDCTFITGDDCIAGINMTDLTVRRCTMNTSCDVFRIGGCHILVEDCHMYGPGYYPHRMTVVRGKNDELPRDQGRHNLYNVIVYFASETFPFEPSHDIVLRNCTIESADGLLNYRPDEDRLQRGTYLAELTLENVHITGLNCTATNNALPDKPLTIRLKNVTTEWRRGSRDTGEPFDVTNPYTTIIRE